MKFRRFGKKASVATFLAAAALVASVAYAAWTTNGTGNGYVKATTSQSLTTVDVSASTTAALYPTGSADVLLRISNPNPYNVTVTGIAGNGAITSGNGTCDVSNGVSFANQTGSWVVPKNGTLDVTLTNAASMSNASVDACKGLTFTVPVALSGASS